MNILQWSLRTGSKALFCGHRLIWLVLLDKPIPRQGSHPWYVLKASKKEVKAGAILFCFPFFSFLRMALFFKVSITSIFLFSHSLFFLDRKSLSSIGQAGKWLFWLTGGQGAAEQTASSYSRCIAGSVMSQIVSGYGQSGPLTNVSPGMVD